MDNILSELLKGGAFVALLAYVWNDAKSRVSDNVKDLKIALSGKEDKERTNELKNDLLRQIEKIEERQIREVEGLRTEMGDLRTQMDKQFAGVREFLMDIASRLPK